MLLAAALILVAQSTGQATPTQAATVPAPTTRPPKKICQEEASTGSIFIKRVCHTQAEWDIIARQNQTNNESVQRRRDANEGPGPLGQ